MNAEHKINLQLRALIRFRHRPNHAHPDWDVAHECTLARSLDKSKFVYINTMLMHTQYNIPRDTRKKETKSNGHHVSDTAGFAYSVTASCLH